MLLEMYISCKAFRRPIPDPVCVPGAAVPGQGHVQIAEVAALRGAFAGHGTIIDRPGGEHPLHQADSRLIRQAAAVEQEVKPRLAAHGAEVDHGVLFRTVAQKSGDDVLHRVHLGIGQQVAGVGLFEAQVEGGDVSVPAGQVQAGNQHVVVHREAGDPFHITPPAGPQRP